MNILPLLNKTSEVLRKHNIKQIYLCGGTGRKFLGVGIDAFDGSLSQGNKIVDIDIIAESGNTELSSGLIETIMHKIAESVSLCLGIETDAVVFRSKFKDSTGRIEISMPIDLQNNIEFDIKISSDKQRLVKNRPTTLMRRKINISNSLDEKFVKTLSNSNLDTLIESGTLFVDCHDKPVRNYVALCDDKFSYLINSERRSYFLRRVCYDMATCGVDLPNEDREWINKEFFPSLYSEKPTHVDIEYGIETLHRMTRGLDASYAIQLLENNNYLGWLFDVSRKEQSILFQKIVSGTNSKVVTPIYHLAIHPPTAVVSPQGHIIHSNNSP